MDEVKCNILIVDDEPDVVDSLGRFFFRRGYSVNTAGTGEEALKLMECRVIDLVLLDIMLPGIKGTQVAAIVKDKFPNTKVVLVTAYPELAAASRDADEIIKKPIGAEELFQRVRQHSGDSLAGRHPVICRPKILLIESSLQLANTITAALGKSAAAGFSYEVQIIEANSRAVERVLTYRPHIVLINALSLNQVEQDFIPYLSQMRASLKEIIVYHSDSLVANLAVELSQLAEAVNSLASLHGLFKM